MLFTVYLKKNSQGKWLRGPDLNRRPSGYEPDELPGCSTPRRRWPLILAAALVNPLLEPGLARLREALSALSSLLPRLRGRGAPRELADAGDLFARELPVLAAL